MIRAGCLPEVAMDEQLSSDAVGVARKYFEYSNASDLDSIGCLLRASTTYHSSTTGLFLGKDSILEMQRGFHGDFAHLEWVVDDVKETSPGIVRVVFLFSGEKMSGEKITFAGIEHVIVFENLIQHISISPLPEASEECSR